MTNTDITPQLQPLTGTALAAGNAVHVSGFFRRILPDGSVQKDDAGPVRAFLASTPSATTPAHMTLAATCTRTGSDGKWHIRISGDALQPAILQRAFGDAKVAYLIVEQPGLTRTFLPLQYADSKAAGVR